eukprot:symbB.v1.2.003860.t1/scaffold211.1/size373615/1
MGCSASFNACRRFDPTAGEEANGAQQETVAKGTPTPSLLQSSSRAASSIGQRNLKGPAASQEEPQKAWAEVPQVAPAALQTELGQQWPSRNWLRRNRKMRHGRI